jgi:tetratricopeptide (TPR) repeat protein
LAEYADGVLAPEARAEIERHLADCADCRHVVAETMAFAEAEAIGGAGSAPASVARVVPFRSRRWVRGVTAGLAAAALLVVAVRVLRPQWSDRFFGTRGDRPELQELVAALANEPTRPVEGRLTGGFKYAPPPSPTRGPGDREVSPDVRIAAAKIESRAAGRSLNDETALGIAYLSVGEYDKAVAVLEQVAQSQPMNARASNDLAVAYIARGRRNAAKDDIELAVETADRAIALDRGLVEAYFNKALALEISGRPASAAWDDYLARDTTSAWAAEAQRKRRP